MQKCCVKILFCKHYVSPLNASMRKGKDQDPDIWLMDPDPGGPKTCGSGSGSPTLFTCQIFFMISGFWNSVRYGTLFVRYRYSTPVVPMYVKTPTDPKHCIQRRIFLQKRDVHGVVDPGWFFFRSLSRSGIGPWVLFTCNCVRLQVWRRNLVVINKYF